MKKLTSIALALILMTCPLMAMAASFDRSVLSGEYFGNVAELSVSDDGTYAFVTSQLDVASRAFTTPYEHEKYYNSVEWDILILDYDNSDAFPSLRVWVRYNGTQPLNIEAVSFVIDGTTYRFEDVSNEDRKEMVDTSYSERAMILFDRDSLPFLAAMETCCDSMDSTDAMDANPITMILHGDEDVTVSLGSGFMVDFLVVSELYIDAGGLDFLSLENGNPMTVE